MFGGREGGEDPTQATLKQLLRPLRQTHWANVIPRAVCGAQLSPESLMPHIQIMNNDRQQQRALITWMTSTRII